VLLVDGHNLIGHTPGLSLEREEEGREQVLRRLAAQVGRGRVVVVFDGDRPGAAHEDRFGGVEVVFSPRGRTADDELISRVAAAGPRNATVVTSDRELAQRAGWLGARVVSCEDFLRRPARARRGRPARPEAEPPVPEEEVESWLRTFRGGHKI
jgi:predicted RNA-binding protein with PIN domain